MAQSFKETAHLKTDQKAFEEGWERIFGKKEEALKEEAPCVCDGVYFRSFTRVDTACAECGRYLESHSK